MQVLQAFETVVLLVILAAIIYGPWQDVCVDWARLKVFECRDEFFDLARTGNIGFDDPSYRDVREAFNQLIRSAHLTWPRFVYATLVMGVADAWSRRSPTSRFDLLGIRLRTEFARSPLKPAIERIADPAVRARAAELIDRAEFWIAAMMVAKSPVILIAGLISIVFALAIAVARAPGRIRRVGVGEVVRTIRTSAVGRVIQSAGSLIQLEAALRGAHQK